MDISRDDERWAREAERRELAILLSHPEIARSANLVRMLTFVCEKYFEGRLEEIRESVIAVRALGRKAGSFDSNADPIVRVTARTLRKRLEAFYQAEGRDRALRLVLPVGRYVPQFVRAESKAQSAAPTEIPNSIGGFIAAALGLACAIGFCIGRSTSRRGGP